MESERAIDWLGHVEGATEAANSKEDQPAITVEADRIGKPCKGWQGVRIKKE